METATATKEHIKTLKYTVQIEGAQGSFTCFAKQRKSFDWVKNNNLGNNFYVGTFLSLKSGSNEYT